MGGQFNNKNPGKRGISLNVRHPKGLEIARRLVAMSDIVAEGFSPGVLDNWGLGYDELQTIKPDIIYVQQSGMGAQGTYGRFRTVGPIANAFAGPVRDVGAARARDAGRLGLLVSRLDGRLQLRARDARRAVSTASAPGEGQWIDASQTEVGLFISGTALLDWSANGRVWTRIGNRSPYKPAAPHGVYPLRRRRSLDRDRVLHRGGVAARCSRSPSIRSGANDPRFVDSRRAARAPGRARRADRRLDEDAATPTRRCTRCSSAGVPAGVCQTAGDRCDNDPQLAALEWLTEVTGTKIGRWPVAEVPVKMSESPAYIGGRIDRGAPCYGEDNEYVYGELLGMSTQEIEALADEGVI